MTEIETMIDEEKLNDLIDACWAHHAWVEENYHNILPVKEIPILWFGDLFAYQESPRKIVTVGLNPSEMEFRDGENPWKRGSPSICRFPNQHLFSPTDPLSATDRIEYKTVLNAYFKTDPYWHWFSHWSPILSELKASYDGTVGNSTALHIDICTPLATNESWSKVKHDTKSAIVGNAHSEPLDLWGGLLKVLRPTLLLLCVGKCHLHEIESFSSIRFERRKRRDFCNGHESHNVEWGKGTIDGNTFQIFNTPPEKRYPWTEWTLDAVKEIAHDLETVF